jgi:hypothetical protein
MAKSNGGLLEAAASPCGGDEWAPEGGLVLTGRVIGRVTRNVRVGEEEHTVYTYKVLAGSNIFWLEIWDGKPIVVGSPVRRDVEVRAYSGKGGVSYRLVTPKEDAK